MGRPEERLEGSGDGRSELCLALAFAVHAVVVDVVIVQSLHPRPTPRAAVVERTVDVDFETHAAAQRVLERAVAVPLPPVPQRAPSPTPGSAPGSAVDRDDPYAGTSPAPMEAAKVLTADGPGDRTAFASGNAVGAYGFVSADGRGDGPTFDPNHGGGPAGIVGGKGWARGREAGIGGPAAPAANLSRPASLKGSYTDACPFPAEADTDHINHALVLVSVTVRPDGRAQDPQVLSDPGHGFAREALKCAVLQPFVPALDATGRPIWFPSLPVRIRFTR